jgi:hypothetical protein
MSKAEERANKRYSIARGDDTQQTSGIDMQRALDFIEGYEQAKKDICEWLNKNVHLYIEPTETIFGRIKVFNTDKLIKDLKQAMKDET